MALHWCDSFDGYTTLSDKWTLEPTNGNNPSIQTSLPRTGARSLRFQTDGFGNPCQVSRVFNSAQQEIVICFAFYRAGTGSGTILDINDGSTTHIRLGINSSDKLVVYRGAGSTLLGTGTTSVPNSAYVSIEIKVKIDDSTGTVRVRMSETDEINLTGQDTRNGGNATADRLRFYQVNNPSYVDDLIVLDTTGSAPNDLIGDCKVECLTPNGNGTTSGMTGSDGNSTDNYALVDEVPPNGDTDYVESATVGTKDTYAYGNLATTAGTVHAVQVSTYAKKSDAGTRKIVSVARLSGTEVDSSEFTLTGSYQYLMDARPTKPGGGSWTIADVNGAEFGVKVST